MLLFASFFTHICQKNKWQPKSGWPANTHLLVKIHNTQEFELYTAKFLIFNFFIHDFCRSNFAIQILWPKFNCSKFWTVLSSPLNQLWLQPTHPTAKTFPESFSYEQQVLLFRSLLCGQAQVGISREHFGFGQGVRWCVCGHAFVFGSRIVPQMK